MPDCYFDLNNLLRLSTIDYRIFRQEIQKTVDKIEVFDGEARKVLDSFPFIHIVKTALMSERDYWIELSIPWLKEIGKRNFIKEIKDTQKNKSVSQRVRHLLLKL